MAKGDLIATLDSDLQDKPSELHKFIVKQKEGADVVCGWRKERKDKSRMVFISKMFNSLLRWLFGLQIHDNDCGFKLYTKEAAKSLHIYGGLYRFIPVLLYQQGFTVDEVVVEHAPRKFGQSKYGFSKIWKNLPDMFTMLFLVKFGKRPLHFFGFVGGFFILIGLIILGYLSVLHFMGQSIVRRPILFFGMVFVIAGFQIFFTGFLADLMISIAHNPQYLDERRAHYSIKYSSDKKV